MNNNAYILVSRRELIPPSEHLVEYVCLRDLFYLILQYSLANTMFNKILGLNPGKRLDQ